MLPWTGGELLFVQDNTKCRAGMLPVMTQSARPGSGQAAMLKLRWEFNERFKTMQGQRDDPADQPALTWLQNHAAAVREGFKHGRMSAKHHKEAEGALWQDAGDALRTTECLQVSVFCSISKYFQSRCCESVWLRSEK